MGVIRTACGLPILKASLRSSVWRVGCGVKNHIEKSRRGAKFRSAPLRPMTIHGKGSVQRGLRYPDNDGLSISFSCEPLHRRARRESLIPQLGEFENIPLVSGRPDVVERLTLEATVSQDEVIVRRLLVEDSRDWIDPPLPAAAPAAHDGPLVPQDFGEVNDRRSAPIAREVQRGDVRARGRIVSLVSSWGELRLSLSLAPSLLLRVLVLDRSLLEQQSHSRPPFLSSRCIR